MNDPMPRFNRDLPTGSIQVELVEALADIVKRLELSEIDIAYGDIKIRVMRQLSAAIAPTIVTSLALPTHSPVSITEPPPNRLESTGAIKSPMVGTAYLRSSPEAPPFVNIASKVKAGDRILLVEAMKTFNDILAPCDGTVTAILVEDGQPVEYDQPLFVIE
jgi:acetyl-CoA carboxylase biotin carboxyl carrier protein